MGRVVIPKEMRRTMHLREGEELEIFAAEDGLVLKKYSAMSALGVFAHEYARVVADLLGGAVYVLDTDGVLSAAGCSTSLDAVVSARVSEVMASRKKRVLRDTAAVKGGDIYAHLLVYPILAHGDLFGGLVVGLSHPFDPSAEAVVETAGSLLRLQLGD